LPSIKKLVIALIGGTVLLIGIALLVLPGPGFAYRGGRFGHPGERISLGAARAQKREKRRRQSSTMVRLGHMAASSAPT
jgi:hypothetical protein